MPNKSSIIKIAIITPNLNSKTTNLIYNALQKKSYELSVMGKDKVANVDVRKIKLSHINLIISNQKSAFNLDEKLTQITSNGFNSNVDVENWNLERWIARNFINYKPDIVLSRGIGIKHTKKIFFRIDLYRAMELLGIPVINPPICLELATNKMLTSLILHKNGILTPDTVVCERYTDALDAFELLGNDVVFKPMYGAKGVGVTRINNKNFAEFFFYNVEKLGEPYYIQKYIEHGNKDIRAFVIGEEVIASMERIGPSWKTNVFQGAKGKSLKLPEHIKEICIKAAKLVHAKIAGVDLIESKEGLYVIEVNAVPGFIELQKTTKINIADKIAEYLINYSRNK
ncbi:MAG: ATP-grasp domain-containing protein [Promethearchaeota archaeon]